MSNVKENFLYSEEHEWLEVLEGGRVRIGISHYAQCQLGDIVFVELPELGDKVEANQSIGSIESVKTVSDLYCPVSGKIVAINDALVDKPELVNEDVYGGGWMVEIELTDSAEEEMNALMNAEKYAAFTA